MSLDELYLQIVRSQIIKKAQENKPQFGDETNKHSSDTDNSQQFKPTAPAPPATSTAPQVAKPATAVKQPDANKKPDTNKLNEKGEATEEENNQEGKQTNNPPQANVPPQPNKVSSISFSGLISNAINETIEKYSKTTIYYMNPKVKNEILNRLNKRQVAIKFAGSNDKFPAIIDNDTYEHYVKAGMEIIYVPLSANDKFFTIIAKNTNKEKVVNAFYNIRRKGYINGFKCVESSKDSDFHVICDLDEYQTTRDLPDIIMEEVIDIPGEFEIPSENRLCMIPESVISNKNGVIFS